MKFLDVSETIVIDEEKRIVTFINDDSKNFELTDNREWNLFLLLLSREGNFFCVKELEHALHVSRDDDVKLSVYKLKKLLDSHGIPCNLREEKDERKIIIENKRNTGILENNGAYKLILPKNNNSVKLISDLFWRRYENLSAQKDGENKNSEVIGKIGDVYQFPLVQDNGNDCIWSVENTDPYNQNVVIEAPNGYGKSTFMRSIVMASSYSFRDDLSEKEKSRYDKIKKFHGINHNSLFIYLECKDIRVDSLSDSKNAEWIYDVLSSVESIRLNRFLSFEAFINLIRDYNLKKKLFLLIDGLDEIPPEHRKALLNKLDDFQRDNELGCFSRIVVTTRPLFWQISFNGYRKLTISNRNIVEDKAVFLKYIKSYIGKNKNSIVDRLLTYVTSNPFLIDIASTPAIIVWIIREYQGNSEFYETIERIIEQMMLRYNSRELTANKDQYKRVYEEIAYKYLCLIKDESGLAIYNTEAISLIRGCIDSINAEGDKQFNNVFSENNKSVDELGELFFTNVALMEYINSKIRFTTLTYAYHLAARYILRCFSRDYSKSFVVRAIDAIPFKNRYAVIVAASSLASHLTDIRFFKGFGPNANDVMLDLAGTFCEYLQQRWSNTNCGLDEKIIIQDAVAQILLTYYGENVFTNPNRSSDNKEYIKWFKEIIDVDLGKYSVAVSIIRGEAR